jgi:dTDP-4-dehydrorhamnose reductase
VIPPLELWGGIECTVNRVGDEYFDQLERCGHGRRIADLERVAALGIRTVRYPLLWERTAPVESGTSWEWADARLSGLRALNVEPILGLLHHGSGPRGTSLLDPDFPESLAHFAGAAARRYPWVRRWTPINEPLTTARFSALYGHWYPHARDDAAFARACMNQYRAIALAMRAIRRVIPEAELVQTEDGGRAYATPTLAYQADFENERRWLTFDAVTGRLSPDSAMGSSLLWLGVERSEIERLEELRRYESQVVLGINYYLTSDRFLDDRLDRYPESRRGGNGRHAYADVEAVRALPDPIPGAGERLCEAWARYELPLAITEAHAACTREQQLRWFHEVWRHAGEARAGGADVRAVTMWALLGAFDWSTLVTRADGRYEPGAYDLRGEQPRATALACLARDLATRGDCEHPALRGRGWWRSRKRRLDDGVPEGRVEEPHELDGARPVLIAGAGGTLGRALARTCEERELAWVAMSRAQLDLSRPEAVRAVLDHVHPWAVVNAAGYVRVDDAETDRDACRRDNVDAAAHLAAECAARGLALVTFSTDLVFDGRTARPYVESDAARPLCEYGASKHHAEGAVAAAHPRALVIRTSAFFGPWDEHNLVTRTLRSLHQGMRVSLPDDETVSPTYVPDLAHAALDLLIDGESGIWHVANAGAVTWVELVRQAARLSGLNGASALIVPCSGARLGRAARRPAYSALGSERGTLLPSLEEALTRYVAARAASIPAT